MVGSTLTASATGFGSGTRNLTVLQPVLGIFGIAGNLTTQSADSGFQVRVGTGVAATPTVLANLQPARKGGGGIPVTASVPNIDVVQLKAGVQSGASVTLSIAERASSSVTNAVLLDPMAAGTTRLTPRAS